MKGIKNDPDTEHKGGISTPKSMNRLHEPIQDHIHNKTCQDVNDTIIAIKLHHIMNTFDMSLEEEEKVIKARKNHYQPSWEDIIKLLERVRNEMNECKIPFKRY